MENNETVYKMGSRQMHFPILNPSKDFECWIFDAVLDSGEIVKIKYSLNETFNIPVKSGVEIQIFQDGFNEIKNLMLAPSNDVSFNNQICDIKIGKNWCINRGEYYEIYSLINGNGAHLKYYPLVPEWNDGEDGIINRNIVGTKYLGWNIPVPMARVEGVIYKNGKEIQVQGKGSHNHSWGNEYIANEIKYFQFGKVFLDDMVCYYFITEDKNELTIGKVLLLGRDGFHIDLMQDYTNKNLEIELKNSNEKEIFENRFPGFIKFKSKNKIIFELGINLTDLITKSLSKDSFIGSDKRAYYKSELHFKLEDNKSKKIIKTNSLTEIHLFSNNN